jgi:glycosyltransferase involved in cell wall biosynthesis
MRIVILYNTSWYVYLLRRNLIAALQQAGCSVTVVAPHDGYTERLRRLGVSHVHLPLHPSSTNIFGELETIRHLFTILRALSPDFVLSYTVKCNLYAGLCQRILPFKLIPNISGLGEGFAQRGVLQAVLQTLYRSSLGGCSRIFFQNAEDFTACVSAGLVRENICEVLPGSGVNTQTFTPTSRRVGETRTFLMMGRLLPPKGFRYFIAAAESIRMTLGDRVNFWILGSADAERPDSMALLKEIETAHARGVIRYLNKTDDVLPILQGSDVVVLPSTYNEGVPRSLLEALACGKPVVTTEWKGCRETVQNRVNGYRVPPHNQNALTHALHHLATCPREELESLGRESRRLAESRFDEHFVIDAYTRALGLSNVATPLPNPYLDVEDAVDHHAAAG